MKVICTTTINPPSVALRKFAEMKDWNLVVAGDEKTPEAEYRDLRCVYLSLADQRKLDPVLDDLIGPNCIQRRNFAFLYACKEMGAEIVATVDDDNEPIELWGENLAIGRARDCREYETDLPIFDPLNVCFEDVPIWHRGFPLEWVSRRGERYGSVKPQTFHIQADLWLGEPDIDAICRMIFGYGREILRISEPMWCSKPAPFNSQNTFLHREVMPHYFCHLDTGRWDDVVAAYYVQAHGFTVCFGPPTVIQHRNPHNIIDDFEKELWGYRNTIPLVKALKDDFGNIYNFLSPRAAQAFRRYQEHFE